MEDFENIVFLGEGAHGRVFRATEKWCGREVVVKLLEHRTTSIDGLHNFRREVDALLGLRHANIIKLFSVHENSINDIEKVFTIVMEPMDIDLHNHIYPTPQSFRILHAGDAQLVLRDILSGVQHMHAQGFVHRDLKPENILLRYSDQTIKIADFGLSIHNPGSIPKRPYRVVTLPYRAPELLLGMSTYTKAVDMWSIGVILAELILGHYLFYGLNEPSMLVSIFRHLGIPSFGELTSVPLVPYDIIVRAQTDLLEGPLEELYPRLQILGEKGLDLLKKLLARNPAERISAEEALQHPFIVDVIEVDGDEGGEQ